MYMLLFTILINVYVAHWFNVRFSQVGRVKTTSRFDVYLIFVIFLFCFKVHTHTIRFEQQRAFGGRYLFDNNNSPVRKQASKQTKNTDN